MTEGSPCPQSSPLSLCPASSGQVRFPGLRILCPGLAPHWPVCPLLGFSCLSPRPSPGPVLGTNRHPLTLQSCSPVADRKLTQGLELARGKPSWELNDCRTPRPGHNHGAAPPPRCPQPSQSLWAREGSPRLTLVCGHWPCCCSQACPGPHSCLPPTSGGCPSLGKQHGSTPHTPPSTLQPRPASRAVLFPEEVSSVNRAAGRLAVGKR